MAGGSGGTCFICPKNGGIWTAPCPTNGTNAGEVCDIPTATEWTRLPHTLTVNLSPDIDEPTEIRTDGTGGNKVKPCAGAISWSLEVTSVLCKTAWLWCYLFSKVNDGLSGADPTAVKCSDGTLHPGYLDMNNPPTKYFYINPYGIAPDGDVLRATGGAYFVGFANVGDYGWDNDSDDPVQTDWGIDIQNGPWFEPCTAVADSTTLDTTVVP